MSQAIQAVLTLLHIVEWDGFKLFIMSDGNVRRERMLRDWMQTYCTGDRAGIADGDRCANISTCEECYVTWTPGMQVQGTMQQWYGQQLNDAREELALVRRVMDHEYILISKVQQVAHDYAVNGEWCSVYEQAMSDLGIEPLSVNDEWTVTITLNVTTRASRRQRAGDESFARQSLAIGTITDHLSDMTLFDSDYEELSVNVTSVDLYEA